MSVTIRAAPRGARIGFATAGNVDHQVLVSVAPKTWRPPQTPRVVHIAEWPKRRHHELILYELDQLHVTADEPAIDELLTRCMEASQRTHNGAVRWDSSLLAPDIRPKHLSPDTVRGLDADHRHVTTDLLHLFDRLDLLTPRPEALHAVRRRSPLHRPLLRRRFLDEVAARMHAIRRGYRTVMASRTTVKGRVDPVSAIRHTATGDPRLVCRYDDLTESTPLLGTICAALERIVDGVGGRSVYRGRFAEPQLRHDALILRRALAAVTTLAVPEATRIGPRLHLGRLDRPWADALRLALAVLTDTEYTAEESGPSFADAVELSVPTDKLWERIVHQVLVRSHFTQVLTQTELPAHLVADPWVDDPPKTSESRPDNVAWRGSAIWVIDAKYKKLAAGRPPDRSDQYQMFSYTHLLADGDGAVERALLIYPGGGTIRSWRRGRDTAAAPVRLETVDLPFPQPTDAHTATTWDTYLDQTAEIFRAAAIGMPAPSVSA